MSHEVHLSDETMIRLKRCAEIYVDKEPEDTIRRLLDHFEIRGGDEPSPSGNGVGSHKRPDTRTPRERGVALEIGGHRIQAFSVSNLYSQVLELLVTRHGRQLDALLPFATSRQRYLIAKSRKHPTGNDFVVPVSYKGYHMEAHKDYKNAVNHLKQLAERMELSMTYLG